MLYNNLSGWLRARFGGQVRKLCLDGGFTCPNRDGRCGVGGCIFCGERGAGDFINRRRLSVREQAELCRSFRRPTDRFIAYFQSFSSTYAPPAVLREIYDAALIDERIVALAVATRPDCVDDEIAALLASYRPQRMVWAELGLQSASDETAQRINRGYRSEVFTRAVEQLGRRDIPVVAHIILGLPGEGRAELAQTVRFLNRHRLWGIKIHGLYVMKGTELERLYREGRYTPLTREQYVEDAVYVLTHIPPELVVHRLTGDCPRDLLVAPDWNPGKEETLRAIRRKMETEGLRQGCFYQKEEEHDGHDRAV